MDRALRETMTIPTSGKEDEERFSIGFLQKHVRELDRYVKELATMIRVAETRQASQEWFKPSEDKKKREVMAFPTNLHVSYVRKWEWPRELPLDTCKRPVMAKQSPLDLLGLEADIDDMNGRSAEEKVRMQPTNDMYMRMRSMYMIYIYIYLSS
jgi:hypothetical protein